MLRIYDQNKQELFDNDILHLQNVSVGLNGNRAIVIESSSNFKIISSNSNIQLAKIKQQDKVELFQSLDYTPVSKYTVAYLNLYSESESDDLIGIEVSNTQGDVITIQAKVRFEDNSDRLVTLLNNNGIRISDLWYKAIKSSNLDEISCIVLNQKRREFLLDLLTLTGCIGGYNNIFAVLDFFEWSDIVHIKEYWKSGQFDKYRITDVNNKIIDKRLLNDGFIKTNWLGLYFDLNKPNGTFDEDGFPLYDNVNIAIEDLWTKLYYLKQILEKTFLPTNVKIIDIVGEYTTWAGIDTNMWVDKALITTIEPNPKNIFDNIQVNKTIKDAIVIVDNYCLRKLPVYIDSNDNIQLENGASTARPLERIFKINKTKNELVEYDYQDYDILTQFYRGDFANVELSFDVLNESLASLYTYKIGLQLYNEITQVYDLLYISDSMSYSDLLGSLKLGVRIIGKFRMVFYIFDGYGGGNIISSDLDFTVSLDSLDIQLYEISDRVDKSLNFDISFYTTIPTIENELIVPDAFDLSFDIADRSTAKAGRYYKNEMTERFLETTINQYNMIENRQLQKSRIIDYSTYHEVLMFRFFDDMQMQMKLYDRHEFITVEGDCETDKGKQEFVQKLNDISFRDTDWKNPFNRYTYYLLDYSIDGTLDNVEKVILAFSKEADRFYDRIIHNLISIPIETSKLRMLSIHKAMFRIDKPYNPSTNPNTLRVIIDRDVIDIENVVIQNNQDLYNELEKIKDVSVLLGNDDRLIVSSKNDLYITHPSIGAYYDVVRNTAYDNLKKAKIGQDFQITIPVFATPEKRYETYDYEWRVINRLTGDIVHSENNEVMAWLPFEIGIFDIELEMVDGLNNRRILKTKKRGGIRIADIPFTDVTTIFYNTEQSREFLSEACEPNISTPIPSIYTVSARKYKSEISQIDADNKALEEIDINGQNWVNKFGTCKYEFRYLTDNNGRRITINGGKQLLVKI